MINLVSFNAVRVQQMDFGESKRGPYCVMYGDEIKSGKRFQFALYDSVYSFMKQSGVRVGDTVSIQGSVRRTPRQGNDGTWRYYTSVIVQSLFNLGDTKNQKFMANTVCFFDMVIAPQRDQSAVKAGNNNVVLTAKETDPSAKNQTFQLVAFDQIASKILDMGLKVGEHISAKGILQQYETKGADGKSSSQVNIKLMDIDRLAIPQAVQTAEVQQARPVADAFATATKKHFG